MGVVVILVLSVAIFYTQQTQKSAGEFYPGTGCRVDSDCKYITYDTKTRYTDSLCANPTEFSEFWSDQHPNISITIDESVECFCDLQEGTGGAPLYVCAKR